MHSVKLRWVKFSTAKDSVRYGISVLLIGMASHAVAADQAAGFPEHPIRLIVPYSPGGANDVIARIAAPPMAEAIGGQIVIDNRPGAGGTIGTTLAARSDPDGYTMLVINTLPHTAAAGLYPKLPHDPIKDFKSIGMIGIASYILVVNNSLPVKTVGEFIALAKHKPGAIAIENAGVGSATHLVSEFFKSATKVKLLNVSYKGGGPGMSDLIAGHVQGSFETVAAVASFVKNGSLRGLAMTSLHRSSLFPDVPTIAESGYPGFDVSGRFGLITSAGTPATIIAKLNHALNKTLANPEMVKALALQGVEVASSTPEEYDALIRTESGKWLKVIKDAHILVD